MRCKISNEIKNNEIDFYREKSKIREKYVSWKTFYPEYLKDPYYKYLSYFPRYNESNKQLKILELCCGMGEFFFDIAHVTQGGILAVDISKESIAICNQHLLETKQKNLEFKVADIEQLHLDVCLKKIKGWLKPEGSFICVDTLGHNPLYNAKRWCATFIWKTRTRQTFLGIPKMDTIERISRCFEKTEVNFFGIFAFMGPFLKPLIGDEKSAKFVNFLDRKFSFLKKYAFKFVLVAKGRRE